MALSCSFKPKPPYWSYWVSLFMTTTRPITWWTMECAWSSWLTPRPSTIQLGGRDWSRSFKMIWWRWCWSCDDSSLLADVIWCTFGSLASGNGAARNQHEADYWYEKAWVISMIARPFAFPHGSVCGTITINGFDGIKLLVAAHSLSFRIFPAQAAVHGYRRPKNSFRSWWGSFRFLERQWRDEDVSSPSSQYDMVWLYRVSL